MKTISKKSIEVHCPLIHEDMTAAFVDVEDKFSITIGSKFKTQAIHGCMRISYCVSNYMTPRKIAQGFNEGGQWLHPDEEVVEGASISHKKIMDRCDFPRTFAQDVIMKQAASELIVSCQQTEKTDFDMDLLNIPRMDGEDATLERTKKVYYQRPAY